MCLTVRYSREMQCYIKVEKQIVQKFTINVVSSFSLSTMLKNANKY